MPAQSQTNYVGYFVNTPLEVALEQWKSEYKLLFAYDHASVTDVYINQQIQAHTLQEALSKLLKNTPLTFRLIESDRVLIFRKLEASVSSPSPHRSLSGRVLDVSTKEPLAFANILSSSGQGTSSDQNGYFTLSVPNENNVMLQVQYIGYESFNASISSTERTNFQIALTPQPYQIESITVVEELPVLSNRAIPQATTLGTALLEKLPNLGVGTDLFRTLQYLPGISAFDDGSAGIRIRGSAEGDNLVILDGITLLKTDHFYGIFSAVNANAIDAITVYKNAFPSEYGGRTAGIIEMETKTTTTKIQQWHGSVELNLLTADANVSIPINSNMSAFIAGRITTRNLVESNFLKALEADKETTTENFRLATGSSFST
ncbi:MAG: TonB-dependent receptor plug domain-containing protein, partial [Saprospiraceae bacterium]|nr:TonB-dependent receptor plug domain-containing protein [Saprospiraceae bacterium]